MQGFVDIYGFLSVALRGLILAAQALTIGGLVFLSPWGQSSPPASAALCRLLGWSAIALCCLEAVAALALFAMLKGVLDLPALEFFGAQAAQVDLAACALAGTIAWVVRSPSLSWRFSAVLGLALTVAQIGATHAASRLDRSLALYGAECAHLLGAGAWIGGIPYFLLALRRASDGERAAIVRRFSAISILAVALLLIGGVTMALDYLGDLASLYGTAYGLMLLAKITLLGGLLCMGAANFFTGQRLARDGQASTQRLRRFAEVEIGIGFTVMFCAASMASLPPPRGLPEARVSLAEIVDRVAPRLPVRFESPDHASLSTSQPRAEDTPAPRNDEDVAWSEYNHHWAGLFVLAMGALALAERSPRLAPFARHWPLVFLGLATFVFLRGDEEVWPLGHLGLIESLRDPEIAQHRFFVLLIALFGLFEWRVRLGRVKSSLAPYVFPMTVAIAAALLLAHSHNLANPKEELLIEITHTPLALVGVAAGWARWLELRLDGRIGRAAGYVWPTAFALAGLMLVFYREA